jgi:tetratricopeptide (TPR) repeat protein
VKNAKRWTAGAVAALTLSSPGGCARKPHIAPVARVAPTEQPATDGLPPLTLPAPTTQPAGAAPLDALRLYAQGRDALLRGRKAEAVQKLSAAIEADGASATVWLDLGQALLGIDDNRALSAFRQASAYDPHSLDARVYAARLLVERNDKPAATEQLRLAQLSSHYKYPGVDAALVDLLLGKLLEEQGMPVAATACYGRVLRTVETRALGLQRHPELAELAMRPSVLRLRMADLAAKSARPGEAVDLYRKLMADEPGAAPVLRLRVAAVLADSGNLAGAAAEAISVVDQFDASRGSVQAYIDLFAAHGGDRAALRQLDSAPAAPASDQTDRAVLGARLERRVGNVEAALRRLEVARSSITGEYVRELTAAYRASGRGDALAIRLLRLMTEQPTAWPQIARGWRILTQPAQPAPLRDKVLDAMPVPEDLAAAKAFVVASVAQEAGKPLVAQRKLTEAARLNPSLAQRWMATPPGDSMGMPDVDPTNERDIELFVDEFSDEPQALTAGVALVLQQGGKQRLIDALQAGLQKSGSRVTLLGPLVALLEADDQKAEAVRLTEQAAARVKSTPELYYLSSIFTQLDDAVAAERTLRQAYARDANDAGVCNDLGYSLIESGREPEFAEALLWKAAGLEPDHPAYIDSVGWMLYKRSKFEEAFDYLDRAVKASDPADPVVLDHAADAAYRIGKADEAVARWKAAGEAVRRGMSGDPQLRLRIDHKLKQAAEKQPVSVAPTSP